MNTAKELIQNLVQSQPEDATYDETGCESSSSGWRPKIKQ